MNHNALKEKCLVQTHTAQKIQNFCFVCYLTEQTVLGVLTKKYYKINHNVCETTPI